MITFHSLLMMQYICQSIYSGMPMENKKEKMKIFGVYCEQSTEMIQYRQKKLEIHGTLASLIYLQLVWEIVCTYFIKALLLSEAHILDFLSAITMPPKELIQRDCNVICPVFCNNDVKCWQAGEEWSDEEISLLAKAVLKYPSGVPQRWQKIADMLQRPVREVTYMP